MLKDHSCCAECHRTIRRINGILWAVLGAIIAQGYTLLNQIATL